MSMMPAPGGALPATLQGTLSSRIRRSDVSPPPAYTAADAAADIYVIKTMRSPLPLAMLSEYVALSLILAVQVKMPSNITNERCALGVAHYADGVRIAPGGTRQAVSSSATES
ncbi:hypothetical protein MRX96_029694 [Rhipicephalus microplus]